MSDVPTPMATYEFLGFRLDPRRRVLSRTDGVPVEITARVFDALVYLVVRAGSTVPREELMAALWPRTIVEDNNLNKLIAALRRALGDSGEMVATVSGRGYQFVAEVRVIQASAVQWDAVDPDVAVAPIPPPPVEPPAVEVVPTRRSRLMAAARLACGRCRTCGRRGDCGAAELAVGCRG